jgi:RNA polymerase sigma-70 factor (ECF subfamily)
VLHQRLLRGERAAAAILFDRHAPMVERLLFRILGTDSELSDLVQEVFVRAFESAHRLRDPDAFVAWLRRLTVCAAMDLLRSRRRRRRWLWFLPPEEIPEVEAPGVDEATREAVKVTYRLLNALPVEERVAFSLRFLDEMPLAAVALACECSLATVKRRIARAEQAFLAAARAQPALAAWVSDRVSERDAEGPS